MTYVRIALAFCISFAVIFTSAAAHPPQDRGAALGQVALAQNARVGNSPVSTGSTIYSGDYLSTEENGSLVVRIGTLSLQLEASSSLHIYTAAYGAVAELKNGAVLFTTRGNENLVIVANDVRLTPLPHQPDSGRVAIEDSCNISVFTQHGQADVQSGSETHAVEEGKTYRVQADNEISYHKYLSPDAEDYHRNHGHKPCVAAANLAHHPPIAPGTSHFLIVSAVAVGTATGIFVRLASESPDHP
jgi:hypothetical protein